LIIRGTSLQAARLYPAKDGEGIMLIKIKTRTGYFLDSLDGKIRKVDDFHFDDKHRTIHSLVADRGNCLLGRLDGEVPFQD
jgi:hypothetical protein